MMAALFPDFFDVRKVTINENKSGMGGYTLFTPKERYLKYATKKFMLANLIVALGGRAAEVYLYRKLKVEDDFENKIFGDYPDLDITTGASNDLIQANKIAKNYITQYGFGNDFGQYDDSVSSQPFIGRDLGMSRGPSEFTKKELDEEIGKLVKFGYSKALELIESNEGAFTDLVAHIKEKRTIDGVDVVSIMDKYNI
jgi:cell division protease FtsH